MGEEKRERLGDEKRWGRGGEERGDYCEARGVREEKRWGRGGRGRRRELRKGE
jgi:hypothetical protein